MDQRNHVDRGEKSRGLTLTQLKPGDRAEVTRIEAASALRLRLLEMGLVPGTALRVVRYAPMGDPIQLTLRGFELTLRHEEASHVGVRRLPSKESLPVVHLVAAHAMCMSSGQGSQG